MSEQNGSTTVKENVDAIQPPSDKGKGKAVTDAQDVSMEVEDSSSEEEVDDNDPVVDEPDEDNMEEIDTSNIIADGRRTRGRNIDFAKAAEEFPEEEDEDEDDDDDFEEPANDEEMEE